MRNPELQGVLSRVLKFAGTPAARVREAFTQIDPLDFPEDEIEELIDAILNNRNPGLPHFKVPVTARLTIQRDVIVQAENEDQAFDKANAYPIPDFLAGEWQAADDASVKITIPASLLGELEDCEPDGEIEEVDEPAPQFRLEHNIHGGWRPLQFEGTFEEAQAYAERYAPGVRLIDLRPITVSVSPPTEYRYGQLFIKGTTKLAPPTEFHHG